MPKWSLRVEQAETSRLARAFALSLALHLLVCGSYYTGKKLNWWQNWRWPAWLQSAKLLTEVLKKRDAAQPRSQEAPLMFVDVSAAQATAEPPKEARFYSDKNSRAANPEAAKDTGVPNLTGTQSEVPKTEDTPREKFMPLQPALPAPPVREEQPDMKAKPTLAPGDLTMAKPDLTPRKDEGEAAQSRPRTWQEAMARQQASRLPGQKMKQEGGVKRHALDPGFDVALSPFGAYDRALIEAISDRWYALLDQRDYASDSRGKVVLQFQLHYDGRITDLNVAENNVGEVLGIICQKAVLDPAPFAVWPGDMRRMLGDSRNIQFTFYYN